MALRRLQRDNVYRLFIASPLLFEDWENPTLEELNSNPTNDPGGLIWNVSCAASVNDSTFETDDPERDDSLTFCQNSAAAGDVISRGANIVISWFLSKERWTNASVPTAVNGFNSSTLTSSLLTWRGHEYIAILSVGKDPEEPFAEDDRIKMARVATDHAVLEGGSGENRRMTQNFLDRGVSDLNWNYIVPAAA
jgi:hypothetical protein